MSRASSGLTAIVPAYNEAESIAETVASLRDQSLPPERILVVDDCSTDGTAQEAVRAGAEVVRPPTNTGSKAGAQTFALRLVDTPYVMAVDADTTLEVDAVELALAVLEQNTRAGAVCGFVLPRHVRTLWERGRYVEYLFAFNFVKQVQDYYRKPLISSGCFSVYRTGVLRDLGGWSDQTMAEDMDLTWRMFQSKHEVVFEPRAVCYPIEPHNLHFMKTQLRRWSHGFVQNVRLHWKGLLGLGYLRSTVAVGFWDALVAPLFYLLILPLLAVFASPWFLLGYAIDLPAVVPAVLLAAWRRGETLRALVSLPGFLVLRLLNGVMMLRAMIAEYVLGRSLLVYEKGH